MTKTETFVRGDKVVTIVETEADRTVDFDDIEGRGESDDWGAQAPWEECDGWEHEFVPERWNEHEGKKDSAGWVRRSARDGGSGCIEIDDETVIGWGHTRRNGESVQVWRERIAVVKRKATEQLVEWYTNGWYISVACATYGDYTDCLGGIYDEPWGDHTTECVRECRLNVADQLEDDGYIVVGRPAPRKPYSAVDHFKRRIRYNLTGEWS